MPMLDRSSSPAALDAFDSFDVEALLVMVDGDLDLVREIIELFFEDAPRLLGDIHRAVRSQDAESLWRSAHALKGSSSNFAASRAVEVAALLETKGRQNELSGTQELADELSRLLDQLEIDLRAFARAA